MHVNLSIPRLFDFTLENFFLKNESWSFPKLTLKWERKYYCAGVEKDDKTNFFFTIIYLFLFWVEISRKIGENLKKLGGQLPPPCHPPSDASE